MLTADQKRRYARNLHLDHIGNHGQELLLSASVLIVGCGALGSITAMYLAGSGVGHITLVDFDTVGLSNLQRQLSFTMKSLGKNKASATAARLAAINPDIEITTKETMLTRHNAHDIISGHDVVIEGSDNPATKHLIATACHEMKVPCVIGGIREWEGQIISCIPGEDGYLEMFPESAEDSAIMPCSAAGVLGPLPGVIASMQAAEAIKIITGAGVPLSSRMLIYDALSGTMHTVHL